MNTSVFSFVSAVFFAAVMVFSVAPVVLATEGECSSDYDGQYFSQKPDVSSDLCKSGSPSGTIEGNGSKGSPWKWHCYDAQGVEGERCEAFENLCGNDTIDAGEQCDGESGCSTSCEMKASCDSDTIGKELESKPSANLCSVGNASGSIEGDGSASNPWKWHCYDPAGNADDKCSATKKVEEIVVEKEVEVEVEVEEPTVSDPIGDTSVEEEEQEEEREVASQDTCSTSDYSDITGYIWHDDNRNGKRDAGEKIFDNVTVELYDAQGKEIAEDETNTSGKFSFYNYAPGKYTIDAKSSDRDLTGYYLVYEPDNKLNGKDQITLKCDNDHTGTNFGFDDGARDSNDGGRGGNGSRPSTLAQTGGSLWSSVLGLFTW